MSNKRITLAVASDRTGLSTRTLRRYIAMGLLPGYRLGPRLLRVDPDDVDALVQVGTNLSMVRVAGAAELWLGKPVVAINTATYWHALRANKIQDRLEGFGRLLAEF